MKQLSLTRRLSIASVLAVLMFFFASCNNNSSQTKEGDSDTIEVGNVESTDETLDQIGDTLDSTGRAIRAGADSIADETRIKSKSTGQAIKEDVNAAKEDVGDAAKAAGKDIKKAANKVADKTKEGYNDVKNKLKKDTAKR